MSISLLKVFSLSMHLMCLALIVQCKTFSFIQIILLLFLQFLNVGTIKL